MNADEVACLCASMTLKEREGPVRTLKPDLKNVGHTVKDCLDQPTGIGTAKGEELLFGFWMRGLAPNMRTRSWGRKWEPREDRDTRGSPMEARENRSFLLQNNAYRGGGRKTDQRGTVDQTVLENSSEGKEIVGKENPRSVSNQKGKESVTFSVSGMNGDSGIKMSNLRMAGNQESIYKECLGSNISGEKSEGIEVLKVAANNGQRDVGFSTSASPSDCMVMTHKPTFEGNVGSIVLDQKVGPARLEGNRIQSLEKNQIASYNGLRIPGLG
ncbi:hypothetical protein LWI29_014169 [Acer saccharum]|uniref:Uncharacterized protein n=1 Tax=Acer saccharum TaxID=4024 RepID=A0AA39T217_ACESA|nr:hypothetical protein LWI29_014169 [Acer saccharum]